MKAAKPRISSALSIAGSDSGGGAGIQADLKTFSALGVYGTTVITCLTAQNPDTVTSVSSIPPSFIKAQLDAIFNYFPIKAVKTGMLYSRSIIEVVADYLQRKDKVHLIVDPVMIATSGAVLLKPSAIKTMSTRLFPLATAITPNVPEAEFLLNKTIKTTQQARDSALTLSEKYGCACVVKGGHISGKTIIDIMACSGKLYECKSERIYGVDTHGTGCAFSAAMASRLATGKDVVTSFKDAHKFIRNALLSSVMAGKRSSLGMAIARTGRDGKKSLDHKNSR